MFYQCVILYCHVAWCRYLSLFAIQVGATKANKGRHWNGVFRSLRRLLEIMTTGSMAFQIPVPIGGSGATTSLPMATHNSSLKTFGCIKKNSLARPGYFLERTQVAKKNKRVLFLIFLTVKIWSPPNPKNLGHYKFQAFSISVSKGVPLVKLSHSNFKQEVAKSKLS